MPMKRAWPYIIVGYENEMSVIALCYKIPHTNSAEVSLCD